MLRRDKKISYEQVHASMVEAQNSWEAFERLLSPESSPRILWCFGSMLGVSILGLIVVYALPLALDEPA